MKTAMRLAIAIRTVLLLTAITIVLVSATATAQTRTFLRMDPICGGSNDHDHYCWMDVLSLRQTYLSFPQDELINRNCEIQIVKPLDRAGPQLWGDAVRGYHYRSAEIEIMTQIAGGGWRRLYYIGLDDVIIKSIVTSGGSDLIADTRVTPADTLTITGAKMLLLYCTPHSCTRSEFTCSE